MNTESLDELRQQVANADVAAEATKQAMVSAGAMVGWDKQVVLILSLSILVFGLITIFTMAYLVRIHLNSPNLLPAFGLPLIIVSAIFLVVTGYSQQQITPVIGLLGTIAGYLLGTSNRSPSGRQIAPPEPNPTPTRPIEGTAGSPR